MIRKFGSDAIIYSIPIFFSKMIGVILIPIYARSLGPEDFGFVEFAAACILFATVLFSLEINQGVSRFIANSNLNNRGRIFYSVLLFTIIINALFCGAIYFLRFKLISYFKFDIKYEEYFHLILLGIFLTSLINFLQIFFRFSGKKYHTIAINLAIVGSNLIITLIFLAYNKLNIENFFYSQIAGGLFGVFLGISFGHNIYKNITKKLNFKLVNKMIHYSLPLFISSIGLTLFSSMDRLMITRYVGLAELGEYSIALKISSIITLVFFIISNALTPIVYQNYNESWVKELISNILRWTLISLIILLALVYLYGDKMINIFAGPEYNQSSNYLFILCISSIISNLYIFFLGMDIVKKTKIISIINLASGFIGVLLFLIFIPNFGIFGALFTTLFVSILRLTVHIYFSQKFYPIKFLK